jgi:hypothetical protein
MMPIIIQRAQRNGVYAMLSMDRLYSTHTIEGQAQYPDSDPLENFLVGITTASCYRRPSN